MVNIETPQNRGQISNPADEEHRAKYRMGTIETFLHDKLGFRTGIDKYNEEMENASAVWKAQQENNAYEEAYNSAEAQAERMRAAGLNPDIAPGSVEPGQATEFTEPESMPESPAGIDLEAAIKAGEGAAKLGLFIVDMASGAIGISTAIQGLQNLKKEGENLEIAGSEEIQQMVEEAHKTYGNLKQGKDEMGLTFANGLYIGKARGLSGKRLGQFARAYDDTYNSIPVITANKANINELAKTQWQSDNMKLILDAEKMTYEATAKRLLVETERNKQIAKVLKDNPEFMKEQLLAGNAQAVAEAAAAGDEAKIAGYREKAEKAIEELNRINAEADQKANEQDNEIITEFYDKLKPTKWDALFPAYGMVRRFSLRREYERATRRRYGRNTDVQDNQIKTRLRKRK